MFFFLERPLPRLEEDLECAVSFVWRCGTGIVAERERRMAVLRHVSQLLEPLTVALAARMSENATVIARAMMLNIMRRTQPAARLEDVGDALYAPHFGLWCAMLDAMRWPQRNLVASMLHGFRSVGDLPDSGIWRPVDRPASVSFAEFTETNASWVYACRARLLSAGTKDSERLAACWERTLEERDSGLIQGPFTISSVE